jgi:hypothetical protein
MRSRMREIFKSGSEREEGRKPTPLLAKFLMISKNLFKQRFPILAQRFFMMIDNGVRGIGFSNVIFKIPIQFFLGFGIME